jgi:hypothetical protein
MVPRVLLVVYLGWLLVNGWFPYMPYVPVTLGMLVASLVAAWGLLRRHRPHARLGVPLLMIPTALLLFGPVDVSMSPRARLGVRLVPVVYGLLADYGSVERGEIQSRGCSMPPYPKLWTVQIGYRLPGLEEWGKGAGGWLEVDELEVSHGATDVAGEIASVQHEVIEDN